MVRRGVVGLIVVLALLVPASALAAPAITSFSPTSGTVGTAVTLTGSGFTGATAVKFNGVSATFTVTNDTTIQTSVPSGATTGKIAVTTPAGTATSATNFKVKPQLTSFAPTSGPVGTSVVITGTAFTGATTVKFNLTAATSFSVDSYTQITATVPAGATTGPISVTTPGGTGKSVASFAVVPAVTLTPKVGPPTKVVSVSGLGFAPAEAIDVFFDTTDLVLAVSDGNGSFGPVSLQVPASAAPGTHWISAVGRHSGLAAQASFLVRANWSQFRLNNRHNGFNRVENVLNPGNVSGLDLDWSATTGSSVRSSPAVANGVVYVGSNDSKLYAFDAGSGAPLWSATTGSQVFSSPAVANGSSTSARATRSSMPSTREAAPRSGARPPAAPSSLRPRSQTGSSTSARTTSSSTPSTREAAPRSGAQPPAAKSSPRPRSQTGSSTSARATRSSMPSTREAAPRSGARAPPAASSPRPRSRTESSTSARTTRTSTPSRREAAPSSGARPPATPSSPRPRSQTGSSTSARSITSSTPSTREAAPCSGARPPAPSSSPRPRSQTGSSTSARTTARSTPSTREAAPRSGARAPAAASRLRPRSRTASSTSARTIRSSTPSTCRASPPPPAPTRER